MTNQTLTTTSLESLREEHTKNQLALEVIDQRRQLAQITHNNELASSGWHLAADRAFESLNDLDQLVNVNDFLRADPGYNGFGSVGAVGFPSTRADRQDGRNRPIFQTETELAIIRGMARILTSVNEVAVGLVEKLPDYCIGSEGFKFQVTAQAGTNPPQELIKSIQRAVDEFLEENEFLNGLDRELFVRGMRDGECFCGLWHVGDGHTQARAIEPEQVTEPGNKQGIESWLAAANEHFEGPYNFTFGVHNDNDDVGTKHGYYVQWSANDTSWDYMPGGREPLYPPENGASMWCEHLTHNVDSTIKRGLSDFFCSSDTIALAQKILTNAGQSTSLQAAIAWIEQNPTGTTKDQVNRNNTNNADWSGQRPTLQGGTLPVNARRYLPGTILRPSPGRQFQPGPGAEWAESYIAMRAACLRSAAARWSMPEHMVSGDASNNNYASILVAGDPFVRRCETRQGRYANYFKKLVWRAIYYAHCAGRLGKADWRYLRYSIELKVVPPQVEVRDRTKETQRKLILKNAQLLSDKTWSAEEGLDYDQEQANIAKETPAQRAPTFHPGSDGITRGGLGEQGSFGGQGGMQPSAGPQPGMDDGTEASAIEAVLGSLRCALESGSAGIVRPTMESEGAHNYATLQINIEEPLKSDVLKLASLIADDDLADKGRETDPHITVLYGILDGVVPDKSFLEGIGWFYANVGQLSAFTCNDYDVIKLEIDSPSLVMLHQFLRMMMPNKQTHPTYQPHITLAYVKSGCAAKYLAPGAMPWITQGRQVIATDLCFYSADGSEEIRLPLGNGASSA